MAITSAILNYRQKTSASNIIFHKIAMYRQQDLPHVDITSVYNTLVITSANA